MNQLITQLQHFVREETCPVNENCVPGFVSGAHTGWGWARTRVAQILASHRPSIPHSAVCLFQDGNRWCAVYGDFRNLQDSPAGFGETFDQAVDSLASEFSSRLATEKATQPSGGER